MKVAITIGERYPDFAFCNTDTYEDGVIEVTPEEFMKIEDATKAYVEAQRFLREKATKAGILSPEWYYLSEVRRGDHAED